MIILLAIIDFPEPGSPIRKRLCPPAAAISAALLACDCPFISEKSISLVYVSELDSVFFSVLNKKTYHLELQINKSSKEQLKKESSFKTVSNLVLSRAVL